MLLMWFGTSVVFFNVRQLDLRGMLAVHLPSARTCRSQACCKAGERYILSVQGILSGSRGRVKALRGTSADRFRDAGHPQPHQWRIDCDHSAFDVCPGGEIFESPDLASGVQDRDLGGDVSGGAGLVQVPGSRSSPDLTWTIHTKADTDPEIMKVSKPHDHEGLPCLPAHPPRSRPCSPNSAPGPRLRHRSTPLPGHRARPTLPTGTLAPPDLHPAHLRVGDHLLPRASTNSPSGAYAHTPASWPHSKHDPTPWPGAAHLRRPPSTAFWHDGNALDAAIGAYLADQHQATAEATESEDPEGEDTPRRPAIALDGKVFKGSTRLGQRCRHLISSITHHRPVTLAQAEVGAKTGETRHLRPLLRDLDLVGHVVTFDACTRSRTT